MASGFFKILKRKKGTALDQALYAARLGRHERKKGDLMFWEDGNLPPMPPGNWSNLTTAHFFAEADESERANGLAAIELIISIPREERFPVRWARAAVQDIVGEKHPYRMAVHIGVASDGLPNPNLHLLFSPRCNDGVVRELSQFFKRANSKHPDRGGAPKDQGWGKATAYKRVKAVVDKHIHAIVPGWVRPKKPKQQPKLRPVWRKIDLAAVAELFSSPVFALRPELVPKCEDPQILPLLRELEALLLDDPLDVSPSPGRSLKPRM